MSDYAPSVGMARARYCDSIVRKEGVPHSFAVTPDEHAKNHAEFDRMIAEVERAAAEKAWDEGESAGQHNAGDGFASLLSGVEPPAPRINPYRAEVYRQERKEQ